MVEMNTKLRKKQEMIFSRFKTAPTWNHTFK